jgi:hypothetical protein
MDKCDRPPQQPFMLDEIGLDREQRLAAIDQRLVAIDQRLAELTALQRPMKSEEFVQQFVDEKGQIPANKFNEIALLLEKAKSQQSKPKTKKVITLEPWKLLDKTMAAKMLQFADPGFRGRPSAGQLLFCMWISYSWNIALHWVWKLAWDEKHKIPEIPGIFGDSGIRSARRRVNYQRTRGELSYQILRLCAGCSEYEDPFFAVCQFTFILREEWHISYELVRSPKLTKSGVASKRANTKARQAFSVALKKKHIDYFDSETLLDKLIKRAISLADTMITLPDGSKKYFEEIYYKPFCKAYSAYTQEMKSRPWILPWIDGGELYYNPGQGRAKVKASIPDWIAEIAICENLDYWEACQLRLPRFNVPTA